VIPEALSALQAPAAETGPSRPVPSSGLIAERIATPAG